MKRPRLIVVSCLLVIVAIGWGLFRLSQVAHAAQSTTILRANGDVTPNWNTGGTSNLGTCTGECDFVDELLDGSNNGDGDGSYVQTVNNAIEEFTTANPSTSGQRATNVRLRMYYSQSANGVNNPVINMSIRINGTLETLQTAGNVTPLNTYVWIEKDFAAPVGGWTKADIDSMQIYLHLANSLLPDTYRVSTLEAVVTWESPNFDQSVSRLYQNQDNIQPGSPLAVTNTVADVAQNTQFRVRMGILGSYQNWLTGSWGNHNNQYKLQYAEKSAATCSVQASGWGDVSGATPIRYFNNATPTDGTAISSNANDPDTGSSTKIYQSYEEANPMSLTNAVNTGQTAIWDFSLENAGSITPGTRYCLRIIQNDGTVLTSYTAASYPEIIITGDYSVTIVDSGGAEVATPAVAFPSSTATTTQCTVSNGTLGVSSQKPRINNDLLTVGWNVTIAATAGSGTTWTAGVRHYDFNDSTGSPAGCSDGGDGDAYAGQLTVDPSGATLTPESSCSNSGVSLGSSAAFNQGTTDAITLVSASASAARFCYWDLTSTTLSQQIPSATSASTYSLDMTLTIMSGT